MVNGLFYNEIFWFEVRYVMRTVFLGGVTVYLGFSNNAKDSFEENYDFSKLDKSRS